MTPAAIRLRFAAVMFVQSAAMGLPMGLAVLFVQGRGVSLLEVGILLAVQATTVVVLELPTGGLADVWGRKRVLLLAFATGGLSAAVLLFSFRFGAFVLAMALSGTARALFSGTADALLVDWLRESEPEVDLQKNLSFVFTASGAGLGLGALLGGFVPRLFPGLPAEGTAVLTPLATPIVLSLVLWTAAVAAAAALLREPAAPHRAGTVVGVRAVAERIGEAVRLAVDDRLILLLTAGIALTALAFSSVEAFWQPRLASFQGAGPLDTRGFGAVVAVNFLAAALGSALAGVVGRWTGRRYGLANAIAAALIGVAMLGLSAQGGLAGVLAWFWGAYLAWGLSEPTFMALFNIAIPSDKRATLISFQSLASRVGIIGGGLGLGYLASRWSIPVAWRAGALVALAVVPLYLYAERLRARRAAAAAGADAASPPARAVES